jgi:hypothetical protein
MPSASTTNHLCSISLGVALKVFMNVVNVV